MQEDGPSVCELCGGQLRRVLFPTGIIFKGSGFYRNDSRASTESSKASQTSSSSGNSSGTGSETSSGSGNGSESGSETSSGSTKPEGGSSGPKIAPKDASST